MNASFGCITTSRNRALARILTRRPWPTRRPRGHAAVDMVPFFFFCCRPAPDTDSNLGTHVAQGPQARRDVLTLGDGLFARHHPLDVDAVPKGKAALSHKPCPRLPLPNVEGSRVTTPPCHARQPSVCGPHPIFRLARTGQPPSHTLCRYVHSKRICHRDLKPDNLLVDQSRLRLKLIDFGCAKVRALSVCLLAFPPLPPPHPPQRLQRLSRGLPLFAPFSHCPLLSQPPSHRPLLPLSRLSLPPFSALLSPSSSLRPFVLLAPTLHPTRAPGSV